VAFASLGLLVGNVTALSASPIAQAVVPALFTLFGGSILVFLSRMNGDDRVVASQALFAFATSCLIGIYLGILTNEFQILGTPSVQTSAGNAYLRSTSASAVSHIDQQYRNHQLSGDAAYRELHDLVLRSSP